MDMGRQASQLGVADVRFDSLHHLRRDLLDAVLLSMLSRFLENLLFRLTPHGADTR
jgi:hypothetical protein